MIEDPLDRLASLDRQTRAILDDILYGRVSLDEGCDRLRNQATPEQIELVRELLGSLDDEPLVDLVQKIVGGTEVPAAPVPARRP